ncbi:TPA: hypothetical protein ACPJ0R_001200 [Vibrio diabolicus]
MEIKKSHKSNDALNSDYIDYLDEEVELWKSSINTFEELCSEQLNETDEWYKHGDLRWYIRGLSTVEMFRIQMKSISNLLDVKVLGETKFSLLVMLHSHAIASIESYLASTFIHKVIRTEKLTRKLVETDPHFSKIKFTLNEIYEKGDKIELLVADYLKGLIFHDMKKVSPMFRTVLGIEFGDISWLFSAITIRHHCTHRAGLDKQGKRVAITHESIRVLIEKLESLVDKIENHKVQ